MTTFVALDLETTGLDATADEIIEIGAVRFTERRIEDEFTTLVRPHGQISPFVSRLTGITESMVSGAPPLASVLPGLQAFVGNAVIVGHNIGFDLRFLRAAGVSFAYNDIIDTYEMASVLMPTANRYGLGALGSALGIPLRASHRALDDARVNAHLYLRLVEMIDDLPLDLLARIVEIGESADWEGVWPFRRRLTARQRAGERPPRQSPPVWQPPPVLSLPAETPEATTEGRLDVAAVAAMLQPNGPLAQHFPAFEHRPQQVAMAEKVAEAFDKRRHLIVEAGTGTGKSIAYLLPAARFALKHNVRVVISTNTKNLQEQLLKKDIPTVQALVGENLRAAVLKGRANYLCPHRLKVMLEKRQKTADEARVLAKVLVWLRQGGSGERGELNLRGAAENAVWQRISADSLACTAKACVHHTGGQCPFSRARTAAQHAHLLVVNHALLLRDVAAEGRVLPDYRYLIIDEAHHLEEAITKALSFEVTREDLRRMLAELGGPKAGLLGRLVRIGRGVSAELKTQLETFADEIASRIFMAQEGLSHTFGALSDFMEAQREGRPLGQYPQQVRLTPAVRQQPGWDTITLVWEDARKSLKSLTRALKELRGWLVASGWLDADEDLSAILDEVHDLTRRLEEAAIQLQHLIAEPLADMIYWVQLRPRSRVLSLHAAPLTVEEEMRRHIWHAKETVVLTSATMTVGGELAYLRARLGAEDVDEMVLDSPFDYRRAALLYVVNDIPEPNKPGYQQAVEHGLIALAKATHGRMMALFTSYAQLQRTARAIRPALEQAGLVVFEQGSGAAPQAMLEEFRTSNGAVLLGTRAFWEGVDIAGEALSALAIVKLPFAVPSDPVVAARSEVFNDPFSEYSLPEAVLVFRQGFGRLIRTKTDRGIVVMFDRRLLTRRYGQVFLDSLPPCTRHQGPLHRLGPVAARWLANQLPK